MKPSWAVRLLATAALVAMPHVSRAAGASLYEAADKPVTAGFAITPGTYRLAWDSSLVECEKGYRLLRYRGDKAKSRVRKLPKLKSKKPVYCAFQLDGKDEDGLLIAVFDESRGTGKGYDRAYVDTNRNRDLSGEKPITWTPKSRVTPWQMVSARQGRGAGSHRNTVQVRWQMDSAGPYWMERKGGWRGKLDSTNGKIDCILLDADGNGLYNDSFGCGDPDALNWQEYDWGDRAFADTNGAGQAVESEWSSHCLPQDGITSFGGSLYTAKASDSGDSITVQPWNGPSGTLLLEAKSINGLAGPAGFFNLIGKSRIYHFPKHDGSPINLPAGTYLLGNASFPFAAGTPKGFRLGGSLDELIEILPDQQTTVSIDGPVSVRLMPDSREIVFAAGEDVGVGWELAVGSQLTSVYVSESKAVAKPVVLRFDGSKEIIPKECPGGG